MINRVAVLLTTFNRKSKTLLCLRSLQLANLPVGMSYDIYLTDDNSTDGTVEALKSEFPSIHIHVSNGDLYWARGMNNAWKRAIKNEVYDAFLLLNDDVILYKDFFENILKTHDYCLKEKKTEGIYVSSTIDIVSNKHTYGGRKLVNNFFRFNLIKIAPTSKPIECQLANANILFITKKVMNTIGVFDEKYIHGIADYDYCLTAIKANFPIFITPYFGGICEIGHRKYYETRNVSLKNRIIFLFDPKGLSFNEYRYYLKKHFLWQAPYYIIMAWMKTLFPIFWEKLKR